MKTPKGLLTFKNRPWLIEQLRQFEEWGGTRAVVVLGPSANEYFMAIPELKKGEIGGLKLTVVKNDDAYLGQFSSIQKGLQALAKDKIPGVFVLPIDVPVPLQGSWLSLLESFDAKTKACVPAFQEKGGHPVLLSRSFMDVLLTLSPEDPDSRLDIQMRLLPSGSVRRVAVPDALVIRNLNSEEEWQQYLSPQNT